MKKVIITGATGLIGSHLVVELLRSGGYEVHCTVRSEESAKKLQQVCQRWGVDFSEVVLHITDIEDAMALRALLDDVKPEVVYHLAAIVDISASDPEAMIATNVALTTTVASAVHNYGEAVLVHFSSIAALGSSDGVVDENTQVRDFALMSPYSKSKFLSENVVWKYSKMGLRTVILNPSVVLGVGSGGGGLQFIFEWLKAGVPFYTGATMGFVDVVDVARAARMVYEAADVAYSQRYILSGANLSYKEFIGEFNVAFGHRRPWFYVPKWLLSVGVWAMGVGAWMRGRAPKISSSEVVFMTQRSAYDGTKVEGVLSDFSYTSISQSAVRISGEL